MHIQQHVAAFRAPTQMLADDSHHLVPGEFVPDDRITEDGFGVSTTQCHLTALIATLLLCCSTHVTPKCMMIQSTDCSVSELSFIGQ